MYALHEYKLFWLIVVVDIEMCLYICAIVESLCEMESRRMQKSLEKCGAGEARESGVKTPEPASVNYEDINVQTGCDKYVAAEQIPCLFKDTFSDTDDESDTKFVDFVLLCFEFANKLIQMI